MRINHQSRRYTKMPWGKYKGIYIKDLSTEYIQWSSVNYNDPAMAAWFAEELAYRHSRFNPSKGSKR